MENLPDSRQTLWQDIIQKIHIEWLTLAQAECSWIAGKIERLTVIQRQLHHLVTSADGEGICRDCDGACCEQGLYHSTLVTVLAHLVLNQPMPIPDFKQSCPYLDIAGCSFSPAVRPYNCLTFICELIEERLTEVQQQSMSALELELRGIYDAFDNRYTGSSLRGLLNREAREVPARLLERRDMLN